MHTRTEFSPPAPPKETRRSGKLRSLSTFSETGSGRRRGAPGRWCGWPNADLGEEPPPASGRPRILPKAERPSSGTRHPTCTPRMGGRLSPSAPQGPGAPQGEEAPQDHLCDADRRPAAASAYGFCPRGGRVGGDGGGGGSGGRARSTPGRRPPHLHCHVAALRPHPGEGPADAQPGGARQVSTPAQSGRKQACPCPSAGLSGARSRVGGARRKRRGRGERARARDGACAVGVIRALRAG